MKQPYPTRSRCRDPRSTASGLAQTPPPDARQKLTGQAAREPRSRRARPIIGGRAGRRSGCSAGGRHPLGRVRRDAVSRCGREDRCRGRRVRRRPSARISTTRSARTSIANIKARLTDLGLRVPAYRIEAIPADEASRRKLLEFAKALEIELILTRSSRSTAHTDVPGIRVAVEDARGMYKQGATTLGANLRDAAKAAPLLLELSKQQPPEAPEWPNKCGDCATSRPSVKPLFFTITPGAAENYDKAVRVAAGLSRQRDFPDAAHHDGRRDPAGRKSRRSTRRFRVRRWSNRGRRESCSSSTCVRPAASTTPPSRTGT